MRILLFLLSLLVVSAPHAATFTVTSAADTAGTTCSAACTLRQAITAANASAAADTINFAITVPVHGEILIQPGTALPTITQPLTINGYSQSGTRVNNDPNFSNAILRIRIDGELAGAGAGISLCAPNTQVRGLAITRFGGIGVHVPAGCSTAGTIIGGNFVGLASSGVAAFGNLTPIRIDSGPVTIGGSALADRNVVAGNSFGIFVGTTAATTIAGNLIGTDKSGALDFGQTFGIVLTSAGSGGTQTIGLTGAPNRIRFNGDGIRHLSTAATLTMYANHISNSDTVGIDLNNDGVTPNDPNDADSGPNGLQNFPVITAAERVAGGLSLSGTLDVGATQGGNFRIALYANSSCDPSGFGEGERFLGSFTRSLSSSAESFQTNPFVTSDPLPPGTFITATATSPGLATSEFSQCFPLDPVPWVVNSANDVADGACNAAHCSLRDAIIAANNASDPRPQSIHFNIATPVSGEIMIQLNSSLPTITRTLAIDGYTQPGAVPNTDPVVSNALPRIRVNGGDTTLSICADGVSVRGLSITGATSSGINVGSNIGGPNCVLGDGTQIAGNFIGLATDGATSTSQSTGINVRGSRVVIGGSAIADRNVISSNSLGILFINTGIDGSQVIGNLIGTDRSGQLDRGNLRALNLASALNSNLVRIGSAAAPNRIWFNGSGIEITNNIATTVVDLVANSLRGNDDHGIDLGNDGPTANDLNDADAGPNGLQNFPVLTRAERTANGLRVTGSLDVKVGVSNAPYRIDVYANDACDASGHGEGEVHVGFASVNLTQTTGENFSFELTSDVDLVTFDRITTTATATEGTSEFSACVTATDLPSGIIVNTDADPATPATAGCDVAECTLREALALANLQQGPDLIRFAIPDNLAPFDIQISTPLPAITEQLTIDGYTQPGAFPNASVDSFDAVIKVHLRAVAGVQSLLRICTANVVEIRGLAFTGAAGPAVATLVNDSGNCNTASTVALQGNLFGFSPAGAALTNTAGILINNAFMTVGGPNLADRNLISNSNSFGVRITGSLSSFSNVKGNIFGRNPDDSGDAPNGRDVEVSGVSNIIIGSTVPGEGNRFHASGQAVLVLGATTDRVAIRGNTYRGHIGATAIDLGNANADGITPNDLDDADSGANEGQNWPVLQGGSADATSITINGNLDVPVGIVAPTNYFLSFYESSSCNDQIGVGNGREGEIFLGEFAVPLTSAAESFSIELPVAPPASVTFITAIARTVDGNTSEFSNCLRTPRPDALHANGFE